MKSKGEVASLCLRLGISRSTYYTRIRSGWNMEDVTSLGRHEIWGRKRQAVDVNAVLRGWR